MNVARAPFTASRVAPRLVRSCAVRPLALLKQRPSEQHQKGQQHQQQEQQAVLSPLAALPLLALALPARADDFDAAAAALAAEKGATGTIYEWAVSIGFGIVVLLLAVVTCGVLYLSLRQWLDKRQEDEDKLREKAAIKNLPQQQRREDVDTEVVRSRTKRDKSKGFGSS